MAASTFLAVVALSAAFIALIRGPHISNLQLWLFALGYGALFTGAFFGFLLYFWDHPSLKRRS